jgi:hypothetical protein
MNHWNFKNILVLLLWDFALGMLSVNEETFKAVSLGQLPS